MQGAIEIGINFNYQISKGSVINAFKVKIKLFMTAIRTKLFGNNNLYSPPIGIQTK